LHLAFRKKTTKGKQMQVKDKTPGLIRDFLNLNEACQFLDYSKSYLYKLTHLKKIPHYKPNGKKLYFKKNDLKNWITRNKVKTNI